jgi:hypothetical protein
MENVTTCSLDIPAKVWLTLHSSSCTDELLDPVIGQVSKAG